MASQSLVSIYYANVSTDAVGSSFYYTSPGASLSPRLGWTQTRRNLDNSAARDFISESHTTMRKVLHATTSSWASPEGSALTEENDSYYDPGDGHEHGMNLPRPLLVSFTVILASLLIIGVAGNVLVILVLIKTQWQARHSLVATTSTTNAYILNLSAADLLFLVFCAPFHGTVYILNHWPFGWLMCKLAHYCQFCTVYASIWILTTMSVDRYVAIGHPLKSVKWRHPTQATRISIVMWIAAAFVSVPWLILYETDEYVLEDGSTRVACYDAWSDSTYHYRKWMILFGFLIGFLIPSVVIFCMALLIAKSIRLATHQPLLLNTNQSTWTKSNDSNYSTNMGEGGLKRRRRVGWLVFALSFVFFICWGPHNFSLVWLNFDSSALEWINEHYQAFFIIKLVAHMMTYLNSSINPVFYCIGSNQFFGRLILSCGFRGRSRTTSSCRTFANRTLQAESVLIQHPLSRSSSAVLFTRSGSPNSSTRQVSGAKTVTFNGVSSVNPRRAPYIPSARDPTASCSPVRRSRAPALSETRKSSSVLVLLDQQKKSPPVFSYGAALPLISKRIGEVKRMHSRAKTPSNNNWGRMETIKESVVIANLHVSTGSVGV